MRQMTNLNGTQLETDSQLSPGPDDLRFHQRCNLVVETTSD
jgi:hypothetical protein